MTTANAITGRHPGMAHTGTGKMSIHALRKGAEVLDALKVSTGKTIRYVWGYDANKNNKEHHSGRSLDFMISYTYQKGASKTVFDSTAGDFIANYVITHGKRLGLIHVIWKQRIYRGPNSTSTKRKGVWEKMADRGNSTQNHFDHPHVWFADTVYKPLVAPAMPTRLTSTLERGSKGLEVQLLQTMLNGLRKAGLAVDGSFGPAVEKAVVAAHEAWGIGAPHTRVGPGFRAKINDEWAKHNAPAPEPAPVPPAPPAPPPAPKPQPEPRTLSTGDLEAIALAVRAEIDSIETTRTVWTRHPVVVDTREGAIPGQRVTPSTLLEDQS